MSPIPMDYFDKVKVDLKVEPSGRLQEFAVSFVQ